jgi:hypothetical protein
MADSQQTVTEPAVRSTALVRRWKFRVEGFNDDGGCVDAAGQRDEDCEYIGTNAEAATEADRRVGRMGLGPEPGTGRLCPGSWPLSDRVNVGWVRVPEPLMRNPSPRGMAPQPPREERFR